jgi:hypothetical protein
MFASSGAYRETEILREKPLERNPRAVRSGEHNLEGERDLVACCRRLGTTNRISDPSFLTGCSSRLSSAVAGADRDLGDPHTHGLERQRRLGHRLIPALTTRALVSFLVRQHLLAFIGGSHAQEAAVQRSRVREVEALEIGCWSAGWIGIWHCVAQDLARGERRGRWRRRWGEGEG